MGTGGRFSTLDVRCIDPGTEGKLDKARIIYRSYSRMGGRDNARTKSVVVMKQQRQIYKLRDPYYHLAYPLPVVAALTILPVASAAARPSPSRTARRSPPLLVPAGAHPPWPAPLPIPAQRDAGNHIPGRRANDIFAPPHPRPARRPPPLIPGRMLPARRPH
ncbi:hypothetical protein U9M48_021166 [Paspalum notatum var. saurae]|uniref:Uncharacterized protein n=1 Tax=Paspalum notatum var. saurae TaxID=547442 RepID=A0AAQ3TI20_PASNO